MLFESTRKYYILTCSTYTSSISTNTCWTKFKLDDEIKLACYSNLTGLGTNMVPIENIHGLVANIKSSSLLDILEWKS
jgi:hypothetical protein